MDGGQISRCIMKMITFCNFFKVPGNGVEMNCMKRNAIVRYLTVYLGLLVFSTVSIAWSAHAEMLLKATANYADNVPTDLFGNWTRTRHIEKSSVSGQQNTTEEGQWVIFRDGKRIVLKNPETGAETEVHVENVLNETAVFNYNKSLSNGRWCHEQLTLTPGDNGQTLQGFQIKECYVSPSGQKPEPYFQAFARVSGFRHQSLPPIQ